jgi:hypothetical protein
MGGEKSFHTLKNPYSGVERYTTGLYGNAVKPTAKTLPLLPTATPNHDCGADAGVYTAAYVKPPSDDP